MQFLGGTLGGSISAEALQATPEQCGLASDAIDAKNEVKKRAHERYQPNKTDPGYGRARITLIKNSVGRGHHREDHHESGEHITPDFLSHVPWVGIDHLMVSYMG